jgi:hypothetical protein
MTQTKKFRPSPAMLIACIALFATTAGTALAAALPKNSVRSAQIVNGAVKTVDLGKDAVRSGKIADGTIGAADLGTDSVDSDEIAKDAVGSEEIAENAVTSAKVAPDSLTADDLAPNSVGSSEVADNSLTKADLGPSSVGNSELGAVVQRSNSTAIAAGANGSVSVGCLAGEQVLGGGGQPGNFGVEMTSSRPNGNSWLYQAKNQNGSPSTITAYVLCLTA